MIKTWATLEHEVAAQAEGYYAVAGVDEVGRGCLAGPVTIGLVILPDDFGVPVTDSKLLSPAQRAEKAELIRQAARVCEVMHVEPEYIDANGLTAALREAGRRIWDLLDPVPDLVLLDGAHNYLDYVPPVRTIVKGDQKSASIAAASIVAKHARDELMRTHELMYPEYGFATHVGYGTEFHRAAIKQFGVTPLHRKSFLKNIVAS